MLNKRKNNHMFPCDYFFMLASLYIFKLTAYNFSTWVSIIIQKLVGVYSMKHIRVFILVLFISAAAFFSWLLLSKKAAAEDIPRATLVININMDVSERYSHE